jgi:hypothetical protein
MYINIPKTDFKSKSHRHKKAHRQRYKISRFNKSPAYSVFAPLHTNYKKLTKPPAVKPTAVFYCLTKKRTKA